MTKRLEELFNISNTEEDSSIDESINEKKTISLPKELISIETLNTLEKIETALPLIQGLENSDDELDELAGLAKEAFNNLLDLGMQTDPRFSAEIFSVGGAMLGHALTAKTAKINKKLKMLDLQLKKADLDRKLAQAQPEKPVETPLGRGEVVDRNELIKMIMANAANKK